MLLSAAGAVYTRHRAREQFVELERLNRERDQLNVMWGQLQLEQSYRSGACAGGERGGHAPEDVASRIRRRIQVVMP